MPRWTVGSRRLRLDFSAGAALGAAAVLTGSVIAGGLLLIVFLPLLCKTAGRAADHEASCELERTWEGERLLARLEPELASVVKQRLGHIPSAWDTSRSTAPPA